MATSLPKMPDNIINKTYFKLLIKKIISQNHFIINFYASPYTCSRSTGTRTCPGPPPGYSAPTSPPSSGRSHPPARGRPAPCTGPWRSCGGFAGVSRTATRGGVPSPPGFSEMAIRPRAPRAVTLCLPCSILTSCRRPTRPGTRWGT